MHFAIKKCHAVSISLLSPLRKAVSFLYPVTNFMHPRICSTSLLEIKYSAKLIIILILSSAVILGFFQFFNPLLYTLKILTHKKIICIPYKPIVHSFWVVFFFLFFFFPNVDLRMLLFSCQH